jgi:hypothetical protein
LFVPLFESFLQILSQEPLSEDSVTRLQKMLKSDLNQLAWYR